MYIDYKSGFENSPEIPQSANNALLNSLKDVFKYLNDITFYLE